MPKLRFALVLLVVIPLFAQTGTTAAKRVALERATADRVDDVAGSQIHAFYVVPSDGTDRQFDTSGGIATDVGAWNGWLSGQTGGKNLRLDTYKGELDVTFFRAPKADAEIASRNQYVRDELQTELQAAGLLKPGKVYAVYYDGSSNFSCGGGAYPPTLPGSVAAMYLKGVSSGSQCAENPSPSSEPKYFEIGMLHELMHTLGFVPACSPHQTLAGHVSDSPTDLMWAGSAPWDLTRVTLDVNHDDYYMAHIPGCLDFSDSPYLFMPGIPPVAVADPTVATLAIAVKGGGDVALASEAKGGGGGTPSLEQTCPRDHRCKFSLASGAGSFLVAKARTGWWFAGWSGAGCKGRAACAPTSVGSSSVTAAFARLGDRTTLTLRRKGSGTIGVFGQADCRSATCRYPLVRGTRARLTAMPASGLRMASWGGACSGRSAGCSVVMARDKSVSIVFGR